MIVAIKYFSKWSEAEAIRSITAQQMINFVWGNIICRFRIPHVLILDNGTEFDCKEFKKFAGNLGIDHRFASVAHP